MCVVWWSRLKDAPAYAKGSGWKQCLGVSREFQELMRRFLFRRILKIVTGGATFEWWLCIRKAHHAKFRFAFFFLLSSGCGVTMELTFSWRVTIEAANNYRTWEEYLFLLVIVRRIHRCHPDHAYPITWPMSTPRRGPFYPPGPGYSGGGRWNFSVPARSSNKEKNRWPLCWFKRGDVKAKYEFW